jgi:hypothetical protein
MPCFRLHAERTVTASADAVRLALTRALLEQQVVVTVSTDAVIEGWRGAQSAAWRRAMLPVAAHLELAWQEPAVRVRVELIDRWRLPASTAAGVYRGYADVLHTMLAGLDRRLGELDVGLVAADPQFTSEVPDGGAVLRERAGQLWSKDRLPAAVREFRRPPVQVRGPTGAMWLAVNELQTMLVIARLIAAVPAGRAAEEVAAVAELAARLDAAGTAPVVVTEAEVPVLALLHEQSAIRQRVPVRTRVTCRECKNTTLTNPDYARLKKRNDLLRNMVGGADKVFVKGGPAPFTALGVVMKFVRLDADFVCPNCQGLVADTQLVALCPECGDVSTDPVLQKCASCDHLFGVDVPQLDWSCPVSIPPAGPLPAPAHRPPTRGRFGGLVCESCGREFPKLWRVMLDPGGEMGERYVCGVPPACAPQSFVEPTQVSG